MALRDHVSAATAVVVERYLAAGLVIAGKTNTPEWGNPLHDRAGPVRADDQPERARPLARRLERRLRGRRGRGPRPRRLRRRRDRLDPRPRGVLWRDRTQTGARAQDDGSRRGHGLEGLVNEHALTRTVRDCAALLDATAGPVAGDPYAAPAPAEPWLGAIERDPAPLRIRWTTEGPFDFTTTPSARAAVEAAAATLAALGHARRPGAPAFDPEPVVDAVAVLHQVSNLELFALAAEALGRPPHREELEPTAWEMLEEGRAVSGERYAGAIATVHAQGRRFAQGLADVDVFLVPTLLTDGPPPSPPQPAARLDAGVLPRRVRRTGWTPMANVSGLRGDLAAARRPRRRTADRGPADGPRGDGPSPARRATRASQGWPARSQRCGRIFIARAP